MKKLTISIFLFISVVFSSTGQNVNITSSFDSSRIFIGDQIKFTVTVDKPSESQAQSSCFQRYSY